MPAWSRAKATMYMTSPLGADVLIPIHVSGHEGISQAFSYNVQAICQKGVIKPTDLLHQPVCVVLQDNDQKPIRYLHGIVQELSADGPVRGDAAADDYHSYRLHIVPKLWFLGQTTDCRVFQNKSVPDILKQLFSDMGMTDQDIMPSGASREYTVQYNETDFHFATRLMEEEGYFYFFEHTASAHRLIVADKNSAFKAIANATLNISGGNAPGMTLLDWAAPTGTVRGKMTLKDYDPTAPDTELTNNQPTKLKTGGASSRDDFHWPALSFDQAMITNRATWHMEAAEASASLYDGSSRFGGLVPGGTFTLVNKPAGPYDDTYVVRGLSLQANDETWLNGGSPGFSNRFTAFPSKVTWRQPLVTPRPRMIGIHTALVLGPQHTSTASVIKSQDGEEIHTDDLARVKVRFYWDHRGEATGNASCWARVVQPWAGNGWGAQFLPRVGTEVAVAFVDGDPDRPIVVGGLYNGRDAPIYSKADKTKSGFRSRSSLKGAAADFNEFTFDDKKDNELIFMHAQKDLTTEVENDQTLKVDNCRIVTIKKDETVQIQGEQNITVKGSRNLTVTDGSHSINIQKGNDEYDVLGNYTGVVHQGNHEFTVKQGHSTFKVSMGDIGISAEVGKITIEAMTSITLKVGQNTMTFDQSGIKVEGMMVKVTGQTMTEVGSPMTTIKGDGMLTLKGGIMNLN